MKSEDLRKIAEHEKYENVIFIGINGDNLTMVSSCPSPEHTAVILESASFNAMRELFPMLPSSRWLH